MKRRTMTRAGILGVAALTGSLLVADVAGGTPGSGVSSSILGRATSDTKIKSRGGGSFDVVGQSITIAPGGHSGWHSHPGQAIVIIKSGTFTTYDANDPDCSPHVYRAGQVYVDHGYGHNHIARNEGSVPLELHITYIDVPVGQAFRTDEPATGNCPF